MLSLFFELISYFLNNYLKNLGEIMLKRLYIKGLGVPAVEINLLKNNTEIVFKQGYFLSTHYRSMSNETPDNSKITVFKHNQNLYSVSMTSENTRYIFGPIMLIDTVSKNNPKQSVNAVHLPQLINTNTIPRQRFIFQIQFFCELISLNIDSYQIQQAFSNAINSSQFNDKLVILNFYDHGAHVSYTYEKALKAAVELGNPSLVHRAFLGLVNSGRIGILSDESELRSTKNWGIICISVTLRSAILAGMDYDQAYSLNDHYVREVEKQLSYQEVIDLIEYEIKDMAQRVKQLKSVHLSVPVRQTYQIILNSPETKITLSQLGNQLGVSDHYLSTIFKNEIGVPISTFKILAKVNKAVQLIQASNRPLSEIAGLLNFSDQAHLTREFSKYVGVTPSKARKNPHLMDHWHMYDFTNINIG